MANFETSIEFHNKHNKIQAERKLLELKEREQRLQSEVEVIRTDNVFKTTVVTHYFSNEVRVKKKKNICTVDNIRNIVNNSYCLKIGDSEIKEIINDYKLWLKSNRQKTKSIRLNYFYNLIEIWYLSKDL